MAEYSLIDKQMSAFEKSAEKAELLKPSDPFPQNQMSETVQKKRIASAKRSFTAFDQAYFPAGMYGDGYSKPGRLQQAVVEISCKPGVQIILGARKHGKTATAKKFLLWQLLTGRITFAGTLAQNLPNSRAILTDISRLLRDNPRISHDFRTEIETDNDDELVFRLAGDRKFRTLRAFSEGRSVRGATVLFDRPQFILCDDLETRQSALGTSQTAERIAILSEAYQSLSETATVLVLGNNFDERCALNKLLLEQQLGTLPPHWSVHVFPAWADGEPLWAERFPVSSEAQLRALLKPGSESEWQGDFQQKPTPPDGIIFSRPHKEYNELPDDVRGVIYCDPNLSKKGKGDSTAIVCLLYSPTKDVYYVSDLRCKSFADSNLLLDALLEVRDNASGKAPTIGFDGHVAQESTWSNNVRNWCRIKKRPYPRIEYRHYRVDDLAKNAQSAWSEGRIQFPPGTAATKEGDRFLAQMFSFAGKKTGNPDDAPDALICAFEMLHEKGMVRPRSSQSTRGTSIRRVIENKYF